MQIGVVGLGSFGTALAQQLALGGRDVLGWTRSAETVNAINTTHRNPEYLSHIDLDNRIEATTDINLLSLCDVLVLAVPSKVLSGVLELLSPKNGCLLISAIKGIDRTTQKSPLECARSFFGGAVRYGVLSGPGFASDIVEGKPAGLVAASPDVTDALQIAQLFTSGALRVYTSTDALGVEIGGTVKNVIAIASGIVDGLALGDSARAGIITRGLAEMMRLAEALGAERETLSGLSGLGDLILTATCDASRNRTVGIRIGRGESLDAIVKSLGSVAEGVTTTELVVQLARGNGVEMPIAEQVQAVLSGDATPQEMVKALIQRPLKSEF